MSAALPPRERQQPVGRRRSVRWRLTAWYAGALGVSLAVVAGISLLVLARVLERRADRYLRAAHGAFVTELLVEAHELPTPEAAIATTRAEVHFEDVTFAVVPRAIVPPSVARTGAQGAADGGAEASAGDARVSPSAASLPSVSLSTRPGPRGGSRRAAGNVAMYGRWWTVEATQPRAGVREAVAAVALAYALALPLLVLGAVVGGYALAGRALAPVGAMARRARAIEAATLHDRLPVADPHDELGALATVINALLARLEDAFAQQRRFVADASHELRTPVAILLAETDVLLARAGRSEAEYRAGVTVLRAAADRLSRLVDDLFLLTRADSGHLPVRQELLYLEELLGDAVRAMRGVAAARGVTLTLVVDPRLASAAAADAAEPDAAAVGAPVTGDPALLDRLVLNLLDNAVKFSPPGGAVTVTLASWIEACLEGLAAGAEHRAAVVHTPSLFSSDVRDRGFVGGYVVRVRDQGPGIPAEARTRVFDRFFRVDASRARPARGDEAARAARRVAGADAGGVRPGGAGPGGTGPGGAGLGLAIGAWIARQHGGSLVVEESSDPGTTLRLVLPAAAPARPLPLPPAVRR